MKKYLEKIVTGKQGIMLHSAVCGCIAYFAAFLLCILLSAGFAVMGVQTREVEEIVFSGFKSVVILGELKIALAYILIGAITGLSAGFILSYYSFLQKKKFFFKEIALIISILSASSFLIMLANDIKVHPALYNESFYARGGILKYFQILITDYVPFFFLKILKYTVLSVYIPLFISISITFLKWAAGHVKKIKISFNVLATISVIFLAAYIAFFAMKTKNSGPNIVVISADSYRHDRVSAYGYKRDISPNINKLVKEGFSLSNMHVQLPRTFPSWYTLYTGRYPQQHGIRHMFPADEQLRTSDIDLLTILKNNGYTTSAAADYAGDIFTRMKGFDRTYAPRFTFDTMIRQRLLEVQFLLLPYIQNGIDRMIFPELRCFAQNSDPEFIRGNI
jgi:hypothetical protein